jgi:ADP-dependent phosphofructokinase/glucokinase
MNETKRKLLEQIKNELKRLGASAGEICTELSRLEYKNLVCAFDFLKQLKKENSGELYGLR